MLSALGDRLRVADRVVELVVPWARGDVLAAVHREGEIVGRGGRRGVDPDPGRARRRRDGPVRRVRGLVTPVPIRRRRRTPPARPASRRRPTPTTGWPTSRPGPSSVRARTGTIDRAGSSTARSARPATRHRPPWSRPWPPRAPSAAIRPRPGRPPTAGPRPAGWPGGSAWRSTPTPSWPPAWAPRSSWPPPPGTCACARRGATPCSPRRSPTRPTPWGRSWPGAGPVPVGELDGGGLDLASVEPDDAERALCCG